MAGEMLNDLEAFAQKFSGAPAGDQAGALKTLQSAASPAALEASGFPGVSRQDRTRLYTIVMFLLGLLAGLGLAGGLVTALEGKESAAFFTFAGLALGGLIGVLAPSPSTANGTK